MRRRHLALFAEPSRPLPRSYVRGQRPRAMATPRSRAERVLKTHQAFRFIAVLAVAIFAGVGLSAPAAARAPSDGFADLAERLLPAVVNISTTQIVDRK